MTTPKTVVEVPLGQVVITPGVRELIEVGMINANVLLNRHHHGDWGDVGADDQQSNNAALIVGSRILSSYIIHPSLKIWIITEADRSSTCLLLPSEY